MENSPKFEVLHYLKKYQSKSHPKGKNLPNLVTLYTPNATTKPVFGVEQKLKAFHTFLFWKIPLFDF
jgi:hypothetical protein